MRSAGQKKCLARELDHVTKPWPKAYDLSCEMLIKKSASENMRMRVQGGWKSIASRRWKLRASRRY